MTYKLREIFTPSSSASLTYIKRGYLDKELMRGIEIPGKQIILYGQTGSGKSTFLKNKLAELHRHFISVSCTENSSIKQLLNDTFDRLDVFYSDEISDNQKSRIKDKLILAGVLSSEITSEKSEKRTKRRLIKPQLNELKLAEILGLTKIVWIIEDFHKVSPEEKTKFSQMLKVFINESDRFPELQIIAVGAVNTAREVIEYDVELSNRVQEIHVPLLKDSEIREIIYTGTKLLNVIFSKEIQDGICDYSNNIASVCHQLCYNICDNSGVKETTKVKFLDKLLGRNNQRIILSNDVFKQGLIDYVIANSDTFKKVIDRVNNTNNGKFESPKTIIKAFINSSRKAMCEDDIFIEAQKMDSKYPREKLEEHLNMLCSISYNEILRFNIDKEEYFFSNNLFIAYLLMQHESGMSKEFYSHRIPNKQFVSKMLEKSDAFKKLETMLKEE